jgi:death on curing protein
MTEPCWLNARDIRAIQSEIIAESGGALGVLDEGMLESTLNKPKNLYHYGGDEVTLYDLAASYGYGLAKNHCFVDGNKRIALIAVYTFLALNGIELIASEVDAVNVFLDLAASSEPQEDCMAKLASWIKSNTEPIA